MTGQYARLGSISSGTMRPEGLIPAFVEALDEIRERIAAPGPTTQSQEDTVERSRQAGAIDGLLGEIEDRMEGEGYYDSEDAGYDLEALTDALNEHAPPYAYFGPHPGDGADYGFWVCWDSLEEDCEDATHLGGGLWCGPVLKLDAGDEWPELSEDVEYVLEVTDHGNGTLFTRDHVEVWSCV